MKPTELDLDLIAGQLAEDISTEEKQLDELGANVFTTSKLLFLKGRFTERLEQFEFWQKKMLRIVIWAPLALVAGGILMYAGLFRIGWLLVAFFPAMLVVSLFAVFLLYQNFGNRGRLEGWLDAVETELSHRIRKAGRSKNG